GGSTRILDITTGGFVVTINTLQFRKGRATGTNDYGAGIRASSDVTLYVKDSLFVGNHADNHGGAIGLITRGNDTGSVQVARSTFYKNRGIDGGGIAVAFNSTRSTITNSTFVQNSASRNGGAINGSFGNVLATQSTFIDNVAPSGGDTSWVVSLKQSLIAYTPSVTPSNGVCANDSTLVNNVSTSASCLASGVTPVTFGSLNLGFLAPWGGLVPTFSIGAGSSAIDAVSGANCSTLDQRGISRSGANCDAGAFEFVAGAPSLTASSAATILQGRAITSSPSFTKTGLTEPVVFRVATEIGGALPSGVSFS
ncbi:MAG: choice-of-anchor Q domain-containing protein, partial [Actinomycetes bacterium]